MEWVWRILQEPKLFSRYLFDGLAISRMLTNRLPSLRQYLSTQKHLSREYSNTIVHHQENNSEVTISFGRNLSITKNSSIPKVFSKCARAKKKMTLDFRKTEFVDGAFMGLLLVHIKHQQKNDSRLTFSNLNGRLAELFHLFCIREILPEKVILTQN
jgi:N-acetylglucosaminyldiphosphoundecaprenol N-acetyl-beta-D-mannosaminyltransferase